MSIRMGHAFGAVTALAGLAAAGCAAVPRAGLAAAAVSARSGAGTLLAAGRVGTRAQVPWRLVGPGWTLAEYSASTAPYIQPRRSGATIFYLIDPAGGRYRLLRWPAPGLNRPTPELVDWSGDKTRALVMQWPPHNAPALVTQVTLATGASIRLRLPGETSVVGYTKPKGLNVLAWARIAGKSSLVRYDLHGHLQKVLGHGLGPAATQSPDGTTVAITAAGGLALLSNAGGLIRRLPVRGAGGCYPERWWNARTILADCVKAGRGQTWLVPANGTAPAAITPRRNGHGADPVGDIGAWALPSGLYLQAIGPCGSVYIVKQDGAGAHLVTVPGTFGNNNRVLTGFRSSLLVQAQTGCPGSESLLWFNPARRAVRMLLRAPHDITGVVAAVPYGRLIR